MTELTDEDYQEEREFLERVQKELDLSTEAVIALYLIRRANGALERDTERRRLERNVKRANQRRR